MKYRKERQEKYAAQHWHEPVAEEANALEEALQAAAQRQDHERPVYRELVKPANDMQTGGQA